MFLSVLLAGRCCHHRIRFRSFILLIHSRMLASKVRSLVRKAQNPMRVQRRSITGKIYTDADAAVADVKDGQTLYV